MNGALLFVGRNLNPGEQLSLALHSADDPEVARDEQTRVFEGPGWHYLCLEIDVPETGDYRTTMMGAMPVVVTRADDGEVVAFENRCAHRGSLICLEDSGHVKDFQCVYHAWRYDLRGNLAGAARYLRQQIDEFGQVPLALAAYNAGPGRVRKSWSIPRITETQNYVRQILINWRALERDAAPTTPPLTPPARRRSSLVSRFP